MKREKKEASIVKKNGMENNKCIFMRMYFYLCLAALNIFDKSLNEKGGIKICVQFVSMIVWITKASNQTHCVTITHPAILFIDYTFGGDIFAVHEKG